MHTAGDSTTITRQTKKDPDERLEFPQSDHLDTCRPDEYKSIDVVATKSALHARDMTRIMATKYACTLAFQGSTRLTVPCQYVPI